MINTQHAGPWNRVVALVISAWLTLVYRPAGLRIKGMGELIPSSGTFSGTMIRIFPRNSP